MTSWARLAGVCMSAKPQSQTMTVDSPARSAIAAMLAWVLPGLGHWYLGHKQRAIIFFVTTSVTFWAGVAIGGVRSTITPRDNGPWIAAQLCVGPQSLVALYWSENLAEQAIRDAGPGQKPTKYRASWPASNISVVYAGVAGLLNLLVIIDALARSNAPVGGEEARGPPGSGQESRGTHST